MRYVLLAGLALLTVLSVFLALRFRMNLLLGIPVAAVVALQLLYNYRPVYYLMIIGIPVSIQLELPGGAAIDFFSELLMLVFLGLFLINLVSGRQWSAGNRIYAFHVIVLLLLFWTFFTMVTSEFFFRSLKFFMSRLWYMAAFVFIAEKVLYNLKSVKTLLWCFFIPLILMVVVITVRHGLAGFTFESAHGIPYPFFANHVVYGATITLFFPFAWIMRTWYDPKSLTWYLVWGGIFLLVLAIGFTYTRGAWASFALLPFIAFTVQRKWFEPLIYVALFVTVIGLGYLLQENRFYRFAPEFKETIFHEGDLEGHLSATFEGKEMSGMERFYRWVAAINMVQAKPFTGFGPSTFNQVYQRYADDAFRTYVSDNPEQSTTHNYFLMTFTEQGVPGGLIFIFLCVFILVKGARLYHQVHDPTQQGILMGAILSLCVVVMFSVLNELIEVDKVGAMFWLNMVFIHKIDVWNREKSLEPLIREADGG